MIENKFPLISVVTISFNVFAELRDTLNSVLNQKFASFESVVVDGGSNDGSRELLQSISDVRLNWISEPDRGIWDAMNKGVSLARGKYVIFMNAGDEFVDENVLNQIPNNLLEENCYIYGDMICKTLDNRRILIPARPLSQLWKSMVFSHQALFAPRSALIKFPFGIDDRVADYRWIVDRYRCKPDLFKSIKQVICVYSLGGISDRHYVKASLARIPIALCIKNPVIVLLWYSFSIPIDIFVRTIKSNSPSFVLFVYRRVRSTFRSTNLE